MWITGKEKVKGVLGTSSRESAGMGSQLGTVFEWRAVQGWRTLGLSSGRLMLERSWAAPRVRSGGAQEWL